MFHTDREVGNSKVLSPCREGCASPFVKENNTGTKKWVQCHNTLYPSGRHRLKSIAKTGATLTNESAESKMRNKNIKHLFMGKGAEIRLRPHKSRPKAHGTSGRCVKAVIGQSFAIQAEWTQLKSTWNAWLIWVQQQFILLRQFLKRLMTNVCCSPICN